MFFLFVLKKKWIRIHFFNQNRVPIVKNYFSADKSSCWIFIKMCGNPATLVVWRFQRSRRKKKLNRNPVPIKQHNLSKSCICRKFFSHQKSYCFKRCILKQKKGGKKIWKTRQLHIWMEAIIRKKTSADGLLTV